MKSDRKQDTDYVRQYPRPINCLCNEPQLQRTGCVCDAEFADPELELLIDGTVSDG